ncbi:hypothetical protein M405DRAFT_860713 [Rhizopogon salebrosus TDB-379]|nr:hypothetical protein M405DRAFT_860713 [Rhizopogon salebrosus TDB-379]
MTSYLAQFRLHQAPSLPQVMPSSPPSSPLVVRTPGPLRSATRAQVRRRVESSDSREAECKRLKTYATGICKTNGLPEDSLEQFAASGEKEMLISVMGRLLAMDKQKEKDEAMEYINSAEFKQSLTDRLRACLLSPNLSGYVKQLSQNLFEFAKKHPSVFKLPPSSLQDLELMNKLDGMIKDILTSQRGSMKQKLAGAIQKSLNIHVLCRSLSNNCTDITIAHWSCVAFLRSSMSQFQTVVAESSKAQDDIPFDDNNEEQLDIADPEGDDADAAPTIQSSWKFHQYWSFIDVLLQELREDALKNTTSPKDAEEYVRNFFSDVLMNNLRKYPRGDNTSSTTPSAMAPSLDSVTVDWQRTIHGKLIW